MTGITDFTVRTESESQTETVGAHLGAFLQAGDSIALFGDLGAGKTAFSRGIARGMGILEPVTSPSYLLCNEYGGDVHLLHLDAYFSDRLDSLLAEGLAQRFGACVLVVEWAEKMAAWLPHDSLAIHLEAPSPESRLLLFSAAGPLSQERLLSLQGAISGEVSLNPTPDSSVLPPESR
ncbi:MAG: tRNA (adenosine(37)-N6)-threonylcarbamoyltransferase complex ATPase subunit type 1 TsaE [Planctomycetota bacterium]|jgi:tRNA threonylcarbamoyladenosine biosynthesis protein TsaE|nr:tRNA (adenosine(37)-N6)-threonylcarbamoyltransferase complex ATPase subunit type 1 TsaE [Planctomycetota bacterium]MDP6941767.1 tRNA (adenosine(37)-N6)-threonylcarbamoyltransferase complex ATPase subunit type 1 TsaE [Planctomycetota bacterium]